MRRKASVFSKAADVLTPANPLGADSMGDITIGTVTQALAVGALLMSFAAPLVAGPYEEGVAAYDAGDYEAAYRLQRPLAEEGLAQAQVNLGIMFAYGRGVAQNDGEAFEWFRRAADQGDPLAQHNLGVIYDLGKGVRMDPTEAMRWFRKAADQGLADAQYDLGRMYAEGRGVLQDRIQAYVWLSLAAAQGYQKAVGSRNLVIKEMTPAQIAEAERLAGQRKLNRALPQ